MSTKSPTTKGGKGKKTKKSTNINSKNRQYAHLMAAGKKKKEVDNPFDKFANAKKKHEVVNRKVKGEDRHVGRARDKVSVSFQMCKIISLLLNCYFSNNITWYM